jgi:hypothetical protein
MEKKSMRVLGLNVRRGAIECFLLCFNNIEVDQVLGVSHVGETLGCMLSERQRVGRNGPELGVVIAVVSMNGRWLK